MDPNIPYKLQEITIDIGKRPPSNRRNSDYSKKVKKTIKEKLEEKLDYLENSNFLLLDDVIIDIKWFVHPQERFETSSTPDVDNIIKPIIDGLCGRDGIMVDDCQVQNVSCSWIDTNDRNQSFSVFIKPHFPELRIQKEGLKFINIKNDLCFPINENNDNYFFEILLERCIEGIVIKENLIEKRYNYYSASFLMPLLRFFHKDRLTRFYIENINTFCQRRGLSNPETLFNEAYKKWKILG